MNKTSHWGYFFLIFWGVSVISLVVARIESSLYYDYFMHLPEILRYLIAFPLLFSLAYGVSSIDSN